MYRSEKTRKLTRRCCSIQEDLIADKVAVVTGGGHGIGKAIVDAFRAGGVEVHIIDIKPGDWFVGEVANKETLEEFAKSVIDKSDHVRRCNVSG